MATLTGQYISQSYQGLINLSTNTSIVAGTMTQLQDGAGTNLGVFLDGQGDISGSSVTSSQDCLINNITVGRGRGNISTNTAIGNSALFSNTTGASNTAIGNSALFANTTGADNIAIGHNALDSNTIGIRSIAIGTGALQNGTTVNNIAIGYNTLYSNTTGSDNIAIGEEALFNNTSGIKNMAYGDTALAANTTGGNNIALGINSLRNNVFGSANIAIGSEAGQNNVSGSNNIIIGYNMTGSANMNNEILIGNNNSIKAHYTSSNWNFYDGVTVVSGSDLTVHDHKQFHGAEFWSTTTQSGSAGVSSSFTFNNTGIAYGVSVVSNSRLTIANAGVYNIQFSAQIESTAGADTVYVWFKKNGSNITASNTKVVLDNNTAQVMTVNILDESNTNDYYEIVYQTASGNATIKAETATGNLPAIPSILATLTQVR